MFYGLGAVIGPAVGGVLAEVTYTTICRDNQRQSM